jgi:hypothetical protein
MLSADRDDFAIGCVDDVILYSESLQEYLEHL